MTQVLQIGLGSITSGARWSLDCVELFCQTGCLTSITHLRLSAYPTPVPYHVHQFHLKDWEAMKCYVRPSECLMPHRDKAAQHERDKAAAAAEERATKKARQHERAA